VAVDGAEVLVGARLERLVVQHLQQGRQSYYELWSLAEHPPMMLTTFMTDSSGSCTLTFSMPASASWQDLAVTPQGESSSYLLRSDRQVLR
jgi:hypothetical protein